MTQENENRTDEWERLKADIVSKYYFETTEMPGKLHLPSGAQYTGLIGGTTGKGRPDDTSPRSMESIIALLGQLPPPRKRRSYVVVRRRWWHRFLKTQLVRDGDRLALRDGSIVDVGGWLPGRFPWDPPSLTSRWRGREITATLPKPTRVDKQSAYWHLDGLGGVKVHHCDRQVIVARWETPTTPEQQRAECLAILAALDYAESGACDA